VLQLTVAHRALAAMELAVTELTTRLNSCPSISSMASSCSQVRRSPHEAVEVLGAEQQGEVLVAVELMGVERGSAGGGGRGAADGGDFEMNSFFIFYFEMNSFCILYFETRKAPLVAVGDPNRD
jgi:hypothetical protein